MPRQLVALSATAIASIYLAGLMSTHGAADSVAAAAVGPTAAASTTSASTGATAAPTVVVGATATPAPTSAPTSTATSTTASSTSSTAAASSSTYVDGTYSGTGTSRFGNVYASVTISGGAISNVQITKVTTSFPMSRIAALPAQVVQKQTANVNSVSGATYSSQAFKQAVTQSLTAATSKS